MSNVRCKRAGMGKRGGARVIFFTRNERGEVVLLLYFTIRARTVIFLLCGGDKSTQDTDIRTAKQLAKEI